MERTTAVRQEGRQTTRRFPVRLGVAVGLLTVALSTGCVASRTRAASPSIPTPPTWTSADKTSPQTSAGDLSQWWTRLGDSTLSDLIARALKNNPGVRTAQSRLRQARAERNYAAANRWPTVTASTSNSGTKSNTPGGSTDVMTGSLDASWEPDVFGAKRNALRAANADLESSAASLHDAQVSLIAEVAIDYVDLRSYQERLEIGRRNEASQAETLQLTQWRAQAGLVSRSDVEQARSNVEQTRAQIPSLETGAAQSKHRLSILLGLSPGALDQQLAILAPVPSVSDSVAVGIPADTLRQRPDIRSAEEKIIAETARLKQTEASRYPSFSLSGSLGLEQILTGSSSFGAIGGSTFAALSGGTTKFASVSGSILQTLFDRGRIRQQINIQNAVQEQAVVSYESTVLTALEDVENALVSLQDSRTRLASLNTAAEAAQNAASLVQNRYSAGLVDFQTVLDTERTVLSIQDSVAITKADRASALIQLYKAMGGGWSPTTTAASPNQQSQQRS